MACRYLGSREDQTTHHPYPTPENVCYAGRARGAQPEPIDAAHQQRHCLGDRFIVCPIYRAATPDAPDAPAGGELNAPPAQAPAPLTAEALYEQGMAHYRRREWIEARECFRRLKALEPNRKAIDDLLDDLNLFIQLQTMRTPAPASAEDSIEAAAPERPATIRRPEAAPAAAKPARRRISPALWIVLAVVIVLSAAGALIATGHIALPASPTREIDSLYNRGQSLLTAGNYEGAIAAFQELLQIDPNNRLAQVGLERAKRLRTLSQLYAEAQQLIAAEDWDRASEKLKSILELDPSYQNVSELSAKVERQRRLIALFEQGKTNYNLSNWAAASADFEQLRTLDPTFRSDAVQEYLFNSYMNDGLALIDGAGEAIDPLKQASQRFSSALGINPRDKSAIEERRLASLYLDGRVAYTKGNWDDAIVKMRDLYSTRPTYAAGWAARTLYSAYVQQGNQFLAAGNCFAALDAYTQALNVDVADKSLAQARLAQAQSCAATPTPTVTLTPTATSTSTPLPPTPTPRATPTPRPQPTTQEPLPTRPPRDTQPPPPPTKEPTPPR
jgi:outer membrane protein assembly factor BamD (BamD/ComL family)